MNAIQLGPGERWALLAALSYTVVTVLLRAAAPTIDPVLGSFVRQIPMAIVSWAIVAHGGFSEFRPGHPAFLGRRFILYLIAGGFVSFVIGNVFAFLSLTNGGLGISVAGIQAGSVMGGLWLGLVFLRERPRTEQLAGAALIIGGLVFVGIAFTGGNVAEFWYLGLLYAVLAGTCYAAANALNRIVQKARPILFVALAAQGAGAIVPLVLFLVAREAVAPSPSAIDWPSVAAVLLAGCANGVANASLAFAVRTAMVATVNTIGASAIVLSFIASVVIFGEPGSPPMIVGVLLVTAGIVVAQLRRRSAEPAAARVSDPGAGS